MTEEDKKRNIRFLISQFRTNDHWAVSLARDILWLVAVVGGIALTLYLLCGAWPAVVTIESTSMDPHMKVGDLVVVVQKDRFGELQTWDEGKSTGYRKFGDYGDVVIYRPNGVTDFWSSVGLLPLSRQHPIIHRAMTWVHEGQPEPTYLNMYRGQATPAEYIPIHVSNTTVDGYTVLYTGDTPPGANVSRNTRDIVMKTPSGQYILPAGYANSGSGYLWYSNTTTSYGGYITKGDNNAASDQGTLSVPGSGVVEPVKQEWVVGKSLFVVPLVGYLPLHIIEVAVIILVLMALHEFYLRLREKEKKKPQKKFGIKKR